MAPVGALGWIDAGQLQLQAVVLSADGTQRLAASDAAELGRCRSAWAARGGALIAQGAAELIAGSRLSAECSARSAWERARIMKPELRELFDEQVELVLAELPQQVRDFMKEVPLVVEDYPSREVMRRMRIRHPSHLYGLYTGIPLIKRSVDHWGVPSDVVQYLPAGNSEQVAGARRRVR